jgi:hypothetical protein
MTVTNPHEISNLTLLHNPSPDWKRHVKRGARLSGRMNHNVEHRWTHRRNVGHKKPGSRIRYRCQKVTNRRFMNQKHITSRQPVAAAPVNYSSSSRVSGKQPATREHSL